jgi:Flp pilus assembly protein TadG
MRSDQHSPQKRPARPGHGGNITIMFALLLPSVVLAIGAAIDLSAWWRARSLVKAAIDSGVMRGAQELQTSQTDWTVATLAAERLYREHAARLPLRDDSIRFEVVDVGAGLTARGSVSIATTFLALVGIASLPLVSLDGSEDARGIVTVGMNARQNLEIALVVDVSAAAEASLDAVKSQLTMLVESVVWLPGYPFRSRAALVAFAEGVGLGPLSATVATSPAGIAYFDMASGTRARLLPTDCAGERQGPAAFTDAPPAGADVLPRIYSAAGRCSAGAPVVPLTSDTAALRLAIGGLAAGTSEGAAGHVGTAWGWYLLSPRWAGSVGAGAAPQPSAGLAVPPGSAGSLAKIAVLIGAAPFDIQHCNASAAPVMYGAAVPDRASPAGPAAAGACASPNGASETQLATVCANMRAEGIRIFSVSLSPYGTGASSAAALRGCASSPDGYYEVPGGAGLDVAMRGIALKITASYLSR